MQHCMKKKDDLSACVEQCMKTTQEKSHTFRVQAEVKGTVPPEGLQAKGVTLRVESFYLGAKAPKQQAKASTAAKPAAQPPVRSPLD